MTSELRPALAVWEADRELTIAALHAWAEHIGAGYSCPAAAQTMLMAATIMQADREAVRAEQAAEIVKERERADKFMWQVRDTCARAERAEQELAKFKALAETLAGALEKLHEAYCADDYGTSEGRAFGRTALIETREALREYKEARDAS